MNTKTFKGVIIICVFVFFTALQLKSQGISDKKSPLMGWASWNQFGVNINQTMLKNQANAMVSSGLLSAGFNYLNIDDGFFDGRDSNGSLKINKTKFPSGMRSLVDYIHSKGLKAGFYSEAGANTCGSMYSGQPGGVGGGLYNHDQQDIDTVFIKWNFDFIKVDYCGGLSQKLNEKTRYSEIRQAINNTGRKDINYNVCRWQFPGTWVTTVANSWRMSNDINYTPGSKPAWSSIIGIINKNKYLAQYASPGRYNDMDMLEVGRGLTFEEDKSHFSMWCILSSPLALGLDMTKITAQTKTILTNPEVIAVNQDTFGIQAHLIWEKDSLQVWAKHLSGPQSKEFAIALLNQSSKSSIISTKWADYDIVGGAIVRDLWARQDLGFFETGYTDTLPAHCVSLIKVTADVTKNQEVFEAEYAWINNFNLTSNSAIVANQGVTAVDSKCSGGAKAGWLGMGSENYIEFRDIYAPVEGEYNLTFYYISGENRTASMLVNDKQSTLSSLNSGSWSTIGTKKTKINLNKGYNKIRFLNTTGYLPDIDKIHIDLNSYTMVSVKDIINSDIYDFWSDMVLSPNPAISDLKVSWAVGIRELYIYNLEGKKVYQKVYEQPLTDVNIPLKLDNGSYLVLTKNSRIGCSKQLIIDNN